MRYRREPSPRRRKLTLWRQLVAELRDELRPDAIAVRLDAWVERQKR